MSINRLIATAVLAAGLLAGCGDDEDEKKPNNPPVEENNLAPVVAIVASPTVQVGETVELDASHSSDPDGDAITLTWELAGPEGSTATLAATTGETNSFVADVAGTFQVTVTADDGKLTTTRTIEIVAEDEAVENQAPVANAGADVEVTVGTAVTLDGTASADPEGATLAYIWTFTGMPEGSEAAFDEANAPKPTFTPDVPGTYTITLVVNDGELDSAADEVVVTAIEEAVNQPPVVDAGEDTTGHIGEMVMLTGTATDADGDALTLTWSLSRPEGSQAELSNLEGAATSFVPDVPGAYDLSFTADDGKVSATDHVTVTVANREPVLDAGSDVNGFTGTAIVLAGTASDPDGHELIWSWAVTDAPTGAQPALTGADTATPTFTGDLAGPYVITASVTDGFATVTDTVTVVLTDAASNQAPIAVAGDDFVVNLGETVELDGSASSDPDGNILTFLWTIVDGPGDATLTDADQAVATILPDAAGEWTFQLTVSDGALSSSDVVVVLVNTPPVADAGTDQTVTVGDTVTLDASGSTDADGDSLDFTWSFVSGPETITFADPTQPTQTFVAGMEGIYVFEVAVADADAVSTDTVAITAQAAATPTTCLIISEYVEGSGNNRALELYNCGTTQIALSDYELCSRTNSNTTCSGTYALSGSLAAGDVYVLCHNQLDSSVTCDLRVTTQVTQFTGDDTVVLREAGGGPVVDMFGDMQPASSATVWADKTFRRECNLTPYTGGGTFEADILTYYVQYPSNTFDGLGVAPVCTPAP